MRSNLPLLSTIGLFACTPTQGEREVSRIALSAPSARRLIGDIDGFGISPSGLVRATPAPHGQPADADGDGKIGPGEFLPDWSQDGSVAVSSGDDFDLRSPAEVAATDGAQWTDHSITPAGASNGAIFTFEFAPPQPGDADYGVSHFIHLVFGDYDVIPATVRVDGAIVGLNRQPADEDGLVQAADATVPWSAMTDGRVVVTVIAPNEPYLAFDYVSLDSEAMPRCQTDADCDDGDACTLDSCDAATGCHYEDRCPDCSAATASVGALWPPDHRLVRVGVRGVVHPWGQETTVRIDGIFQDEPAEEPGDGHTCPDASGAGGPAALLRAERSGTRDGRVYHVWFTATDADGYACAGEVTSCVPHDRGEGAACVDQGALYDSLECGP